MNTRNLPSQARFTLLAGALGAAMAAAPAGAATLELDFDSHYGAQQPAGPAPWLTATFDDSVGPDTVRLTIDAAGLGGDEFVSNVFFHLDSGFDGAADLSFSYVGTTGPAADSIAFDDPSAGPDGDYEIKFAFDTSNKQGGAVRFNADEVVVYDISASGLGLSAFDLTSDAGYYAAAHVQGIGAGGGQSDWIGASKIPPTPQVPIPAAAWLFGSGLLGLVGVARRRR